MFKIIGDKQVADELWQAGVLWWKYKSEDETRWQVDDTQSMEWCKPSNAWSSCDHAIRVEE